MVTKLTVLGFGFYFVSLFLPFTEHFKGYEAVSVIVWLLFQDFGSQDFFAGLPYLLLHVGMVLFPRLLMSKHSRAAFMSVYMVWMVFLLTLFLWTLVFEFGVSFISGPCVFIFSILIIIIAASLSIVELDR